MKNILKTCLLVSSLGFCLNSQLFATDVVSDTLEDTGRVVHSALFGWGETWNPDYLVEDTKSDAWTYLDGIAEGVKVDDPSYVEKDYSGYYGDKITNLHTSKSGIITGVADQGTMDSMTPRGNMVRYEYVIFKTHK
jgi:hypothetical protein